MNKEPVHSKLLSVASRLLTDTPQRRKDAQRLDQMLSRSLLAHDVRELETRQLEVADLFVAEPATEVVAADVRAEAEQAEFRVSMREVPVQSTRLRASLPEWAAGAAIDRTIGPLTATDGRQLWFDFLRIEKLVALYIQNNSNPSLLFHVRSGIFISPVLPLSASPSTTYRLGPGSIWINSQIFAADSPAGNYTGLTIRGGQVTLSSDPQTIAGRLTVAPSTLVTVELDLQPPDVNADPSSPYGVDARDSEVRLPERLVFRFSGGGSTFTEISRARWNVFGHAARFEWDRAGIANYDAATNRVLVPFSCSERTFKISSSKSPLNTLDGETRITRSAWALPSAPIDIANPTPAAGIGALLVIGGKGLFTVWKGLADGEISSTKPYVMAEPGRLSVADQQSSNAFAHQEFRLWKDDLNRFGTSVDLRFSAVTPFLYFTLAEGTEALMVSGNADMKIDRPVTVTGEIPPIRTKKSLMIQSGNKTGRFISLFDDNIVSDNVDLTKKPPSVPKPISLALRNALFKVSPVNGCVLFGNLNDDFTHVTNGFLYLTFGMYAYVPTLPDPYAANLGVLQRQFRVQDNATFAVSRGASISMWLVCSITWQPNPPGDNDKVDVSFNFAPLQNQFQPFPDPPKIDAMQRLMLDAAGQAALAPDPAAVHAPGEVELGQVEDRQEPLDPYGDQWNQRTRFYGDDAFALLDVSTNADLLGISFGTFGDRRLMMIRTHRIADVPSNEETSGFPLRAKGMDVVSQGANVRAFTVPQISWEPVFNLTPPEPGILGDPTFGFNYYPDDGGPTRILNASSEQVALAPIPLTDFLVNSYANVDDFAAVALFTLPFGLRALALLKKQFKVGDVVQNGTNLSFDPKIFDENLASARQLELDAGESPVVGETNMFVGCTMQENNVLELDGSQQGNSTLGRSVTKIFNLEFMPAAAGDIFRQRGVPLTQISLGGYGATTFSHWVNPKATIAATSQTKFDVMLGRCAHEIIQVKSIMYPWGIRVVRTITLTRTNTNYVYRYDSGWQPESDGKFDFSYYANEPVGGKLVPSPRNSPYEIHPGIVKGLFNVKDIRETRDIAPFKGSLTFAKDELYIDEKDGRERAAPGINMPNHYELQPVYFTADVEIENPVTGFVTRQVKGIDKKLVPSKGILGFVQLAPRGMPIPVKTFKDLVNSQMGSIGGPVDTLIDIGNNDQEMRLNRFDFNNSFDAGGKEIFAVAGRGNVVLPKDGSWSLVKHESGTGNVSPVPQDLSVPLIRIGKLQKPTIFSKLPLLDIVKIAAAIQLDGDLVLDLAPKDQLLRIANPTELLRNPVPETINYGFLHSTDTQKVLYLTPSFRTVNVPADKKLLSRTPPLFADAFRLANSKAAFPNIKDAFTSFGEAIPLITDPSGNPQFIASGGIADAGKPVLQLMNIQKASEVGYKLAKQALGEAFPLPDKWDLINIGNSFRIYIDYKAAINPGSVNYDVDSAANMWKSRMSNVGLKVDLGPFQPLLTIKGNWDAQKGSQANFGGAVGDDIPRPQIVLSEKLEKVMWLLEILQDLSGEKYGDAVGKGVRLAMSNKAGSWEYKIEAAKEIPLLRFPPGLLYHEPTVPLKLEAGLRLGAYFNSALQIETDKKQLLPSAGAFFGFFGRLSVMCLSLDIATIYAVGQANLDFGADTKAGPFLRMKFGFGAQIVVGLPVILNVSVLYMIGVEIYLDKNTLEVSAFLLFSGRADILSGLLTVTITIEAKGTVVRDNANSTSLAAQVTFALEITVFWVIDITISESWGERRQIAGSLIGL